MKTKLIVIAASIILLAGCKSEEDVIGVVCECHNGDEIVSNVVLRRQISIVDNKVLLTDGHSVESFKLSDCKFSSNY